jgi:hypothetical protein
MNDPTSILEQVQRRSDAAAERSVMAATRRLCVCVLVLLFLTIGAGSMPSREAGAQEFTHQAISKPAWAGTSADQELVAEGVLSTRARHKTH